MISTSRRSTLIVALIIGLVLGSRLFCIFNQRTVNTNNFISEEIDDWNQKQQLQQNTLPCNCPNTTNTQNSLNNNNNNNNNNHKKECSSTSTSSTSTVFDSAVLNQNLIKTKLPSPSWISSDLYLMGESLHKLPRRSKVKVAFGIPTVKRPQRHDYLSDTLTQLIERSSPQELEDMLIIVFLADKDKETAASIFESIIVPKFSKYIQEGLIDVVTARPEAYPVYPKVLDRHTFNDDDERIKWRSKQCIDFALIMEYAYGRAEFYMQLEDDITPARNYLTSILDTTQDALELPFPWSMLEFSRLGFIGKLFRDSELLEIASLFRFYHLDQPVDYLMIIFLQLKTQPTRYFTKYSLFQHNGKQSSLPGKQQLLKDHTFRESGGAGGLENIDDELPVDRSNFPPNPAATLTSNVNHYSIYSLASLYRNKRSFWGGVGKNSFIQLKFLQPTLISKITIKTGHPRHKSDTIQQLAIKVSHDGTDFMTVFEGSGPDYEAYIRETSGPISAVRIEVTKDQPFWGIITQLSIYERKRV